MNNSIESLRHTLRALVLLGFTCAVSCSAQTIHSIHIKSIRINGTGNANFPLAMLDSQPVTISFDVDAEASENFCVKVFHCDKDWNVTPTSFINDDFRNHSTGQIPFEAVPAGVKYFRWTYSLKIPGITGLETLPQSGNYKVEIWNDEKTELLADAKIFAVEILDDSALTIYNRYQQSEISPLNQVNKAVLSYTLPPQRMDNPSPLYMNFVKTVDIYRNRELERPHRIDADNRTVNTFVDGIATNSLKFISDNLQPGNEYRHIDLRNADLYPPFELLRARDGADVSRWMWQGKSDHDGVSILTTGNRYADYVQFQFELGLPEEDTGGKIYVVGDFNGWKPDEQWVMQYDDTIKHDKLLTWLRRGAYDYQYVRSGNDWVTLEGNDWRTVNVYTALVYYHDVRYGGFDRILLAAQKKSPGGTEANSN